MWVTTGYKPTKEQIAEAHTWAERLNARYVERRSDSINRLMKKHQMERILVVTQDQPRYYVNGVETPYFFHPGLSLLRIKSLIKGDNDLMLEVAGLKKGDSFLDCTLGLGADAIVASYAVGEHGRVVGIESERIIAELTRAGLASWSEEIAEFNQAMQRIEVICDHHLNQLRQLPDQSFDVVYFDPMFRKPVHTSSGIASLRGIANPEPLTHAAVCEALRVCRRRVMMKERTGSKEFARLGFNKIYRASASITYGVLEKEQ
jgi:16S rRNA (guanine1516-N2)-methyltransferase